MMKHMEHFSEDLGEVGMSIESDIVHCLTDDLRRAPYKGHVNPLRGHCYVASEALYHLKGGKAAGLKPMFISHEGAPHWFLADTKNKGFIDLTSGQFETPVPYHLAKGKGFLTAKPSARAAKVIQRVQNRNTPVRDRQTKKLDINIITDTTTLAEAMYPDGGLLAFNTGTYEGTKIPIRKMTGREIVRVNGTTTGAEIISDQTWIIDRFGRLGARQIKRLRQIIQRAQ